MSVKSAVYLDYNATTPLLETVRDAMRGSLDLVGNPSSIHGFGREARKHVELAREYIAQVLDCSPTHITFTSGATEANNNVLFGAPVERILVSAIEHPSVIDTAKELKNVSTIPVTSSGAVDLAALEKLLAEKKVPTLVSVMWVNNETGVIQPIAEISALTKKYDALFHCDAVQAFGRISVSMQGIDYLSLSAHKIGGPAGVGALVFDHDAVLKKFVHGGGQERRRRAGTENTLGIIGFGAAAQYARSHVDFYKTLAKWRDALETKMKHEIPEAVIVGQNANRVGNTTQVILPGAASEKQLMALDLAGIAVSSGSACSSGSIKPSHVLLAMGISEAEARCAIRISMGFGTTEADLETFFQAWVANSQRLRAA